MDLIYMNASRVELGVLQHYTLDLDIAKDMDFEIVTLDDNVLLEAGYWWYIDGTEYGGRIDKVSHDTKNKTVKYYGRNWRGILNSKIIEPADSTSFVYADGNVAAAISSLVTRCEFGSLFSVDTTLDEGEEELATSLFAYPRYCTLYEGINSLLNSLNAKLRINYNAATSKVVLKPVLVADHSDYLTYISVDSLNFVVSQRKGGINHLVCLGQSNDDGARAIIHLFLDSNNALQKFRNTETPVRNSDYILDKSKQKMFGLDERAIVFDSANSQITYNYVLLARMPGDWQEHYNWYYVAEEQEDDDLSTLKYKSVEPVVQEIYTLTTSKPSDWEDGQGKYYTYDGEKYNAVGLVESTPTYTAVGNAPDDWSNNYGSYYIETWNGVEYVYSSVISETKYSYTVQTAKPSDWSTNFKAYYMLKTDAAVDYRTKKYTKVTGSSAPTWKANTYYKKDGATYTVTKSKPSNWSTTYKNYYTMEYVVPTSIKNATTKYVSVQATASGKAPSWQKNKYYTRYSSSVAPKYDKSTVGTQKVVTRVTTQVMPDWEANTYYSYVKREVAPAFTTGTYYEKTEDWYKVLVEGGIEKLADLNKSESQTVTLAEMPADVGDVVSGYDIVTGIEVYEHVTNVIVKIKNNVLFIDYEIGGTT